MKIYDLVQAVKKLEQDELAKVLKKHGTSDGHGCFTYDFATGSESLLDLPCISAYIYDEPADGFVQRVTCDSKYNYIKMLVQEKQSGDDATISGRDVFAGQLEIIIDYII